MSKIKIEERFCKLRKQNVLVEIEIDREIGNEGIIEEDVNKCLDKESACESFGCEYALEGLGATGQNPF